MKLADIAQPVTPVHKTDAVADVLAAARVAGVEFLPVVDEHAKYIGVVTTGTLLALTDDRISNQPIQKYVSRTIACFRGEMDYSVLRDTDGRAVIVDADGRVLGIVTSARLVEVLYRLQGEMEETLSAVLNSAQNGILAIDSRGFVIMANRTVEVILGLSSHQIIGRYVADIIPNTLMLQVFRSCQPLFGQRMTLANTPILANYSPVEKEGVVIGVVCIFQDLSSIEKISTELSTVKGLIRELEAIIHSSYDGIFITDGNGVVLRLNEAYERITGIKAMEVINRSMRQLVEEGLYDQSVTILVLEKRQSVTINQIVKRNNKHILVTGNPIFDENGDIFRVVTNVRDVTELSNLQQQLTKSQEQSLKYQAELSHLRLLQAQDADIIFRSSCMSRLVELARRIAGVDSNVLITGESGTGKELIAKLIHRTGKGASKPFIKINCGAIPEQLLESELFGYEGGAFTSAKKEGKPGLFELAHNGTLFLDEVGELPLLLQVKLLRVIQEREVMRVGGVKPVRVNVRIIAATNRDLAKMVAAGEFREDLYYRLMVIPIHLPPLRERQEDIPLLIMSFLEKYNRRFGYNKVITAQVVDKLVDYPWPGNVRELENVIERLVVTASEAELTLELLPDAIARNSFLPRKGTPLKEALAQTEKYLLTEAYTEFGSWQKVAEQLGVDRTTVFRKASRYGLLK